MPTETFWGLDYGSQLLEGTLRTETVRAGPRLPAWGLVLTLSPAPIYNERHLQSGCHAERWPLPTLGWEAGGALAQLHARQTRLWIWSLQTPEMFCNSQRCLVTTHTALPWSFFAGARLTPPVRHCLPLRRPGHRWNTDKAALLKPSLVSLLQWHPRVHT